MSSLTSDDRVGPNDPEYYAPPRWLRDRPESRLPLREGWRKPNREGLHFHARPTRYPARERRIQGLVAQARSRGHPGIAAADQRPAAQGAVQRRRPLRGRRRGFGRRGAVLRHHDPGGPATRQQHARRHGPVGQGDGDPAAGSDDGPKPAMAEFQAILTAAQNSQPVPPEQSEELLQQFVQWRQKPASSQAP